MKKGDVWVIALAYNEQRHIGDVVKQCKKEGFKKVVVVDDGSKDHTTERAQEAGAIVLRHAVNMHKGAAMKTGAEYALVKGAKAIIFLDGDGQHSPSELSMFLDELNKGYDIVFGARKVGRNMPIVRRLGKILTGITARLLYGMKIHDVLSGYRALRSEAYEAIKWSSLGYTVESEMVARAGKANLKYSEITIKTIYHDKYKGVNVAHGISIMGKMLWWRLFL